MRKTDPYSEIKRAPYALPKGVPALQEEPGRTRRWMLGFALASAVTSGLVGFYLGTRASAGALSPATPPLVAWARKLALSDRATLARGALTFLSVVEEYGGDDILWSGIEALIVHAESGSIGDEAAEHLRARILKTLEVWQAQIPRSLRSARDRLLLRTPPVQQRK